MLISGPVQLVQALQRFWASTARESCFWRHKRDGVSGTSPSRCFSQVFGHLQLHSTALYTMFISVQSKARWLCQQHPSPCHQGFLDSAASFTQQTLCEVACEKRLAEWKRDHARNPMDHRGSRVRRITTTLKGAGAPFVVKAAVHHCHRTLSSALRGMTETSGSFVMMSLKHVLVASASLLTLVLARL